MDFSDHDLGNHNHNHHHHDFDLDGRFGEEVGPVLSPKAHRDVRTRDGRPASDSSLASSAATAAAESPRVLGCRTTVLLLVFHGGSVLDSSHDASAKASDVATFQVKAHPRGLMRYNT